MLPNRFSLSLLIPLTLFIISCSAKPTSQPMPSFETPPKPEIPMTTYSLQFEPLKFTPEDQVMPLSQDEIRKVEQSRDFKDTRVFIYRKQNDPDEGIYGGIQQKDTYYSFGKIGYGNFAEGITIESVHIYDQDMVRVNGFRGANYRITFYLEISKATPSTFLYVDGGAVYEGDLNGDHIDEVISSFSGGGFITTIYSLEKGRPVFAYLNGQLNNAASVYFTKDHIFEVQESLHSPTKKYKYDGRALVPLK